MQCLKRKVFIAAVAVMVTTAPARAERRPKVLTPVSANELVQVLYDAHVSQLGKEPSPNRLAMGWAQVALENRRGAAVWNHNLGNVGPGRRDNVAWYFHTPYVKYRSFDTFLDSGRAYWRTVSRCSTAANAFDAGLPVLASHALKRCGYYGAPIAPYTDALVSLYNNGLARVAARTKRQHDEKASEQAMTELERRRPYTPACGCCAWE